MNLPQFLNQVDEVTQGMSKDDLTKFIHQHARTLVECERSEFLSALKICAGKTPGETSVETILQEEAKDLREEVGQSLETLQQICDGKDGLEEFLPLWIDYLGRQEEDDVEKLLVDAVSLMIHPEPVMEAAKKYAQFHPIIYEQLLKTKMGGLGDEEWYALGREAMGMISEQYRIRGRIALLTAACALRLGRKESAENCWLEAFRSDTTPLQYFCMAAECQDFSRCSFCIFFVKMVNWGRGAAGCVTVSVGCCMPMEIAAKKGLRIRSQQIVFHFGSIFANGENKPPWKIGFRKKSLRNWNIGFPLGQRVL